MTSQFNLFKFYLTTRRMNEKITAEKNTAYLQYDNDATGTAVIHMLFF